jgi:hypothetical protein
MMGKCKTLRSILLMTIAMAIVIVNIIWMEHFVTFNQVF